MSTYPLIDGATPLRNWGIIRAHGADAAGFIHNQLTHDFALMGLSEARLAGYCSAKGRLLASFVAWKTAHDELLLACHASVLAATLKRLSMFVLRAKCKLSDASSEVCLYGVAGPTAHALLGDAAVWHKVETDGASVIRLPDAASQPRALWSAPTGVPSPHLDIGLDAWRWLEVQSGMPVIEAATVEQFVPQMLNFELIGGVNFQKGCYPGQEIVARTQYRGATKRRMFLFDVDAAAVAGQEVFHSADPEQPAGMVVNAAPRPDQAGFSTLVEIKLAALQGGSIHLGTPDGPALTRLELPYAVTGMVDQDA